MYIYLHKTNNHLCVYMYAYMDTCKVFKQASNLVFYAQSTIAVISGQSLQIQHSSELTQDITGCLVVSFP